MHRVLLLLAFISVASQAEATIIDSINGSATPASNLENGVDYGKPANDIGWYYTPTFSYTLDGIYSEFGQFSSNLATPMITVQIQTDRPVNGGVLLAQATFQGNSYDGGELGGTFSPVLLTAGQTYFVDFMGMNGMGVNVGQWADNAQGVPMPSAGANTDLGAYYEDSATSTGFAVAEIGNNDVTLAGQQLTGNEPILYFDGFIPTPEPSSNCLMLLGAIAALLAASYRRIRGLARSRHGGGWQQAEENSPLGSAKDC